MERRSVLLAGTATMLAGCFGGGPKDFADAEDRWPPQGRFVQAEGRRIHVWDQGQGTPVVLIHGASGNLRDWTWMLGPEIAKTRRAVAMDRPGMGYSERVGPNAGDPATQARALMAAAREMGLERPIIVGHSLGAAVACAWALADPENVGGLVTVSGFVMPTSQKPMLAEMVGLDRLLVGAYFNYVRSSAAQDGVERFVRRIFRPQEPPEGYVDHVGGPLAMRPAALAANKEDIASLNTALRRQSKDYGRIKAPVEVISGTEDFIINPQRQPVAFSKLVPNARVTLLDGVGHMAHHVRPDTVLAALDRLDPPTT
ncbi:MAG: alpha/beta hydrolase [Pseudomonadota bacterium]